ncbi:MAG: hypothetical protein GOU99_02310 [Candidatus Altiarchaeota archaeon]|nr:hypothetical protein [Candidatus Altiarchaeota archaeon]
MMLIIIEGLGSPAVFDLARMPVFERLGELGVSGVIKTGWTKLNNGEMLWRLLGLDGFPGMGPVLASSYGVSLGKRSAAQLRFCEIKKTDKGTECLFLTDREAEGKYILAGRTLEIIGEHEPILVYDGSTRISENWCEPGELINKPEPLSKDAKTSTKLLRTFSNKLFEQKGLWPVFRGFGKFSKFPRLDGTLVSKSRTALGVAKLVNLKTTSSLESTSDDSLRIVYYSKKWKNQAEKKKFLENLDKSLLHLISQSEKETIAITGTQEESGFPVPYAIAGPNSFKGKINLELHEFMQALNEHR